MITRKYANRPQWQRVLEKRFKLACINDEEFNGYISLIYLDKVKEPLIKNIQGIDLILADKGYKWLQITPLNANYSLTTMFDNNDNIIEWYFDITKENGVTDQGMAYWDDLLLDLAVLPSGDIFLLDEDELYQALNNGDISTEEFDLACKEAKILERIISTKKLTCLCNKWLKYMENIDLYI
ncbi:DUF402 domain-containing protein [Clostridium polyendosporum]|uniref:DUF402 domain-containing protein n=1 Tax=Clostridium polyendosporum TaxID=69208 RepID=UPI001BB37A0E|nr:DUF402 domain-containing protein [Clostridium polyendosporum]